MATPAFSLFAFDELRGALSDLGRVRLILPPEGTDLRLLGEEADRPARNRLQAGWLARRCAEWVEGTVELRRAPAVVPQAAVVLRDEEGAPQRGLTGSFAFTTDGLGIAPSNTMSLIQAAEADGESRMIADWFENQWGGLRSSEAATEFVSFLKRLATDRPPALIYATVLRAIFGDKDDELTRSASSSPPPASETPWSGRSSTSSSVTAWSAPSTSSTASAAASSPTAWASGRPSRRWPSSSTTSCATTACWCSAQAAARQLDALQGQRPRNILAADRFNYDVLNHTDLSRDGGLSGDIDLAHVNWGNYDLVVIDESHNFRNKRTPQKGGRDPLRPPDAQDHPRKGVKTRVLMLSATRSTTAWPTCATRSPSPPRATTRRWLEHGIGQHRGTTRLAQKQFNRWLDLDELERTPSRSSRCWASTTSRCSTCSPSPARASTSRSTTAPRDGPLPGAAEAHQHQGRCRPGRASFPPSGHQLGDPRLNLASYAPCATCCPHKQEAYDRSTAPRSGRRGLLPAGRPRGEPDPPAAGQRAQADGERRVLLRADRRAAAARRGGHARAHRARRPRSSRRSTSRMSTSMTRPSRACWWAQGQGAAQRRGPVRWKQDLIEDRNRLATLLRRPAGDGRPGRQARALRE
jgi:hypothetical protein